MLKKTLVLLACSAVALTLATPVLAQSTAKIDKIGGPVPEATTPTDTTKPDTTTKTSQPATTAAPPSATRNTAAPSAAAPNTPAPNAATPSANPTLQNGTAFVPLTQFPQIQQIATASSLPQFLNTLYKICIGAAAALALLMIMYAGVEIMRSSGSVTTNEKAKSRIQNAILGLVLVLAPTIVFGIINPSILDLNFGKNFGLLQSAPIDPNAFSPTNPGATINFKVVDGATEPITGPQIPDTNDRARVIAYMGTCTSTGGTPRSRVGSTLVACTGAPAGTPPGCRDATLRCEGGNNNLSATVQATGTVLKKYVTGVKSASNVFMTNCQVDPVNPGTASTRGCTRTCSPVGTASCDVEGCSEYTSFCSIPAHVVVHRALDTQVTPRFVPVDGDVQKVSTFRASCTTDHGTFSFNYGNTAVACTDGHTNAHYPDCVTADLRCSPF